MIDIQMGTDRKKMIVNGVDIEFTEQNVWRYIIPYLDQDLDCITLLRIYIMSAGYLSILKKFIEANIFLDEVDVRVARAHGHPEMADYLENLLESGTYENTPPL